MFTLSICLSFIYDFIYIEQVTGLLRNPHLAFQLPYLEILSMYNVFCFLDMYSKTCEYNSVSRENRKVTWNFTWRITSALPQVCNIPVVAFNLTLQILTN